MPHPTRHGFPPGAVIRRGHAQANVKVHCPYGPTGWSHFGTVMPGPLRVDVANVERYFRDAPLMIVGEGTNEIQRNVIAAQLVARGGI